MPKQAINRNAETGAKRYGSSQQFQKKEYRPSDWVTGRLAAIPTLTKEGMKRIYDIDIDEIQKTTKRFGILEGFASNNHTLHPIHYRIDKRERLVHQINNARLFRAAQGAETILKYLENLPGPVLSPEASTLEGPALEDVLAHSRCPLNTLLFRIYDDLEYHKLNDELASHNKEADKGIKALLDLRNDYDSGKIGYGEYKKAYFSQLNELSKEELAIVDEVYTQYCIETIPPLGFEEGWGTVRLWTNPVNNLWDIEIHEALLGYSQGKDGETVKKEDGTDKKTWNRQELREGDVIRYRGRDFSAEQMNHFRLTGTLGNPISEKGTESEESSYNFYLDEYNNHEVIVYPTKFVNLQMQSKLGEKNSFWLNNTEWSLDADARKAAALGCYVWASNIKEPSEKINVWFDPRTRNFRPTIASDPHIGYDQARHAEITQAAANERRQQQNTPTQTQSKSQSVSS